VTQLKPTEFSLKTENFTVEFRGPGLGWVAIVHLDVGGQRLNFKFHPLSWVETIGAIRSLGVQLQKAGNALAAIDSYHLEEP
jgi:hypothetical protein